MIEQYDITMDAKDQNNPVVRITLRIQGLPRNTAMFMAETHYPLYKINYVIAGHKEE